MYECIMYECMNEMSKQALVICDYANNLEQMRMFNNEINDVTTSI